MNLEKFKGNLSIAAHAEKRKSSLSLSLVQKSKKLKIVPIVLILSCVFIGIFVLNHYTGYTSDDYRYHYYYEGFMPISDTPREIADPVDLITSQISHWRLWNGRIVAHTLVQIFMQFPKTIFNFFNSLAFVALGCIIYSIILKITNKKDWQPLELIGVFLGMWFVLPQFGLSVLWLSGSCNYLWCALFYMSLLLLYLHFETHKINLPTQIAICLLAFLAGGTNENSGAMIIFVTTLFSARYFYKHRKIELWKILVTLLGTIGWCLMMASPGSLDRGGSGLSLLAIAKNFYHTFIFAWQEFHTAIIILIILATIIIYCNRPDSKKVVKLLAIPILGFLAGIFCLSLSPEQPARTFFGPSILILVCLGICIMQFRNTAQSIWYHSGVIFLLIAFMNSYMMAAVAIHSTWVTYQTQINAINANRDKDIIVIKCIRSSGSKYDAFNGTATHTAGENDWLNRWAAAYYGVHRVRCENP